MTSRSRVVPALSGRRGDRYLFGLLMVALALTARYDSPVYNDVRGASAAAYVVGVHGTMNFADVGFETVHWGVPADDGSIYTNRFPGAWLPAVPAYALATPVLSDVAPTSTLDVPIWPATITAFTMVAFALVVLRDVLRNFFSDGQALGVTLVTGFATPVWTVAGDALWTHSAGVLVLALAMRSVVAERYVVAGAWLGAAILVRPTHAFTAFGIGVALAWFQREWRRLAEIGLPSGLAIGLMSAYSRALFGTWLPVGGYDTERVAAILGADPALTGEFTWGEQLVGTFVSAEAGIFVYSAFLLVCVAFIVPGVRASPLPAKCLAIGGLLYWGAQLRGNRFTGGIGFFGYRFPIEPLWLGSIVLARAWFVAVERRVVRLVATVLLTLSLVLNLQFEVPRSPLRGLIATNR